MALRVVPDRANGEAPATSAPDAPHPDHHLWRNGRLWWVAFTVHLPGWKKDRVRVSLGTADLAEARRRRDALLARYPLEAGCELSLRFDDRKRSMAS
jgi:hypothetical protein